MVCLSYVGQAGMAWKEGFVRLSLTYVESIKIIEIK